MKEKGKLVISLDFELAWGILDKYPYGEYDDNLIGTRQAIISMLELFKTYDIAVTWATVGLLFNDNLEQAISKKPTSYPTYDNENFSNYRYFKNINSQNQSIFFAPDLIELISKTSRQEIASHTYSHFYCLEKSQTSEQFISDIKLFKLVSKKFNIDASSIVFPRNQVNFKYLDVLFENGFKSYRGMEDNWLNKPVSNDSQSIILRALRFIDSYINLSGSNSYEFNSIKKNSLMNIKSSRFLRPSIHPLLDYLQIRRVVKSMRHAAINNEIYHLWWHPHNLGVNLDQNLKQLSLILKEYRALNLRYGFNSVSMKELRDLAND